MRLDSCLSVSGTRNEDWPDPCEVKRNKGKETSEMSYSVVPNSANPMAILFVVDQSGSMSEKMQNGKTKAEQVATVINKTISELVIRSSRGDMVKNYYEVGVIGYSGKGVCNALGGAFAKSILNPITLFEQNPLRIEDRITEIVTDAGDIVQQPVKFPVWFEPMAYGGTPMCSALKAAAVTIAPWCDSHSKKDEPNDPGPFPPVIIHITDGESGDGDPLQIAELLRKLSVKDGNVLMCNLHVSTERGAAIYFPASDLELPNAYAKNLFNMSSVIPSEMMANIREELRGKTELSDGARFFTFNGDEVAIVKFIRIGTQGTLPRLTYAGER